MAFSSLSLARLFHGFTCRNEASIGKLGLFSNLWSVGAFAAGALLLVAVLSVPGLQRLFMAEPLSMAQMGWIVGLAALPTVLIQLGRAGSERFL